MRIVIAGAHGQIGLRLVGLLAARGDEVIGLIRNSDHNDDVSAAGGTPVICDLETASADEVAQAIGAVDVAVFAAGAGPGSGAERKVTVDRDGAIKLLDATEASGARYLVVSSVGAESPPSGDSVFDVYLRAKAEADAAVTATDRAWVIVRPGPLSNDPGTGRVRIGTEPFRADVTRDDVAAVLAALAADARLDGTILYLANGEVPIEQALSAGRV
ncbi:MAG TPA: NAD(P)H-binding protein [Solirubrobacteraceae bacterium]|jgi:nucleoside-diphosphate-sugar epimerase|nr:NAD(P)H-binding protein [Solirubrobacteraceae bacterium]